MLGQDRSRRKMKLGGRHAPCMWGILELTNLTLFLVPAQSRLREIS